MYYRREHLRGTLDRERFSHEGCAGGAADGYSSPLQTRSSCQPRRRPSRSTGDRAQGARPLDEDQKHRKEGWTRARDSSSGSVAPWAGIKLHCPADQEILKRVFAERVRTVLRLSCFGADGGVCDAQPQAVVASTRLLAQALICELVSNQHAIVQNFLISFFSIYSVNSYEA